MYVAKKVVAGVQTVEKLCSLAIYQTRTLCGLETEVTVTNSLETLVAVLVWVCCLLGFLLLFVWVFVVVWFCFALFFYNFILF